jgi:hypothetical protein
MADRDRRTHHRRVLASRRKDEEQSNQAASDGISKTVETDIDDGLSGAFVLGGDGCEEDLVAGLEERAAERGFTPARDERTFQSWEHETAEPADRERKRRRGRRHRQPEFLEREPACRGLHHEGQETHAGVVQREEAQQRVTSATSGPPPQGRIGGVA